MAAQSPLSRLCLLQPGQVGTCYALLTSKERGTTRDGKPYYRVSFRDSERSVTSMIWHNADRFAECGASWKVDTFYKLRALYSETQYGPQSEIDRIREVTAEDR